RLEFHQAVSASRQRDLHFAEPSGGFFGNAFAAGAGLRNGRAAKASDQNPAGLRVVGDHHRDWRDGVARQLGGERGGAAGASGTSGAAAESPDSGAGDVDLAGG